MNGYNGKIDGSPRKITTYYSQISDHWHKRESEINVVIWSLPIPVSQQSNSVYSQSVMVLLSKLADIIEIIEELLELNDLLIF